MMFVCGLKWVCGAEHDELLPGPQADEADRPRRYGRTQLAEDFRTWEGV